MTFAILIASESMSSEFFNCNKCPQPLKIDPVRLSSSLNLFKSIEIILLNRSTIINAKCPVIRFYELKLEIKVTQSFVVCQLRIGMRS